MVTMQRCLWLCLLMGGLHCSLYRASMCQAQWSTSEKGTVFGAVAGGGAGAAIGKKSGNPIVGAVVGGIGGAILGNALGEGIESRRANERYAVDPRYGWAPAPSAGAVYNYPSGTVVQTPGVSLDEVIQLTRGGLGDDLIVYHIEQTGFSRRLTADDLIRLKGQGVSDRVIQTLQRQPLTAAAAAPTATRYVAPTYNPPVRVVEEVYVVPTWSPPTYYYPRPVPYYGHPHNRRSSSTHLHFRF